MQFLLFYVVLVRLIYEGTRVIFNVLGNLEHTAIYHLIPTRTSSWLLELKRES